MRQVVTGLLVLVTLVIGAPLVGADPSVATVTGQIVDAGGRGTVGQSVELVRDGAVVATTVTTVNGAFTFASVAPANYVVRTMVNNHSAGTRISVKAGESIPVTVVLPSLATASPIVGPAASLIASFSLSGGLAMTNTLLVNMQKTNDINFIQNVNFAAIERFINTTLSGFDVDRIRIGPYSTS